MGLDMYLEGRKWAKKNYDAPEKNNIIDEFSLKYQTLDIGYWRKHPNLHGFIVENFADGEDECQEIELSIIDLEKILEAVNANELPRTTGFFFGESAEPGDDDYEEEKNDTVEILTKAIKWLELEDDTFCFKSVIYQASW